MLFLPLPGTEDVQVWKTWSYGTLGGITQMYGVGGHPPTRGVVSWHGIHTTVDYPPGTLYGLRVVAALYRAARPSYEDSVWLTVLIKLSVLVCELILCLAIARLISRYADASTARAAVLFYWVNPAALLDGAVLGYLDAWAGASAMLAMLAADRSAPLLCGVALTVAVMTKLQAVFIVPVAALILWRCSRSPIRAVAIAALGAIVTCAAMLVPFALAGALPNLRQGVMSLLRHDMLSGTAANLWWIVTWIVRASYAAHDLGAWAAWTMTVRILGVSRLVALGWPNPRPIGAALTLAAAAWALWRAARSPLSSPQGSAIVLAAGAFIVHAYFVLAVQVHENHLYLALPLMAAAAAVLPQLRAPLAAVSAISALNLFLLYGIGRGVPLPPRHVTILDTTVLLSMCNLAALAWHGRVLHEASRPAAVDLDRDARHV